MFGRNFHTEKMVPRVSRSVHARFTVIVGLLPVIVGLLPVIVGPVHARFTLGSRSVHASDSGPLIIQKPYVCGGSSPGLPMIK